MTHVIIILKHLRISQIICLIVR